MSKNAASIVPSPGQIVRVRQRQYLVEQTVPPPVAGDSTLVRLSCVDDDNQGQTETIREELGSLSQVIDSKLEKTMSHGIRRKDIAQLEAEIESADLVSENRRTVEQELEAVRERQDLLREQIERLRNLLDSSQKSIGLDEGHFRSAISCALELVGSAPLKPLTTNGGFAGPPRFAFPALDQREGADPSWADTMDTLRAPRKRDQKRWEWRRTSPIRP